MTDGYCSPTELTFESAMEDAVDLLRNRVAVIRTTISDLGKFASRLVPSGPNETRPLAAANVPGRLFAAPSLAVFTTFYMQRCEFVRTQREQLLRTLMVMRAEPLNPERIRALAAIDIVFNDKPTVRSKWKEFYESLTSPAYKDNSNAGFVWLTKQNEMLAEMARTIGYGKTVGYEELMRLYAPQAFADNAAMTQDSQKEFLLVLKASENFSEPRKGDVMQLKPAAAKGTGG
jgi:hypothetical protein